MQRGGDSRTRADELHDDFIIPSSSSSLLPPIALGRPHSPTTPAPAPLVTVPT